MKKVLIVTAVVVVILLGLFFWKGGHHALMLENALTQWLDADKADLAVTLQIQMPAVSVEPDGAVKPEVKQFLQNADGFWMDYDGERVLGLSAEGVSAYLWGGNLILDSGRAYSLPEMKDSLNRLTTGLLLYGRVTKKDDTYHLSMKTKELELSATVTADPDVQNVTLTAVFPEEATLHATITPKDPGSHTIPSTVADARNRAIAQPPMALTEPLQILLPVAENLLPLSADLELGVSCGILELKETVDLSLREERITLTRKGKSLDLELPDGLSPALLAVLFLRDGEFTRTENGAQVRISLSEEAATALLETLVPQAADLGITLGESSLTVTIREDRLTSADLTAQGSVPFLFTTIPVDFSAVLTVK